MLHTKDLMIGDWVIVYEKSMPVKAKVEGVFGKMATVLGCQRIVEKSFVEPIPLTPEILAKNGFHYTNEHTLKGADTYILRLEQRGFDFTITIKLNDYFALDSYDDRVYRLVEISTGKWYVHELQHALRLCGIEHDIIL